MTEVRWKHTKKASVIIAFGLSPLLTSCNEVKIVQTSKGAGIESAMTQINPMSHPVQLMQSDLTELSKVDCLNADIAFTDPTLSEPYKGTFTDAAIAHLAPQNFSTGSTCGHNFILTVDKFSKTDALFASRIKFSLDGTILTSTGRILWHAKYNFSSVDGGLPLDPISSSFGLLAAKKNSSNESMNVHIYTAVRRLISALPQRSKHERLSTAHSDSLDEPLSDNLARALELWKNNKIASARSLLKEQFEQTGDPSFGYYLGLMFEADSLLDEAADVYATAALEAAKQSQYDYALKALKKLEKINQESAGQHKKLISDTSRKLAELIKEGN